jgi:hypothetical protein
MKRYFSTFFILLLITCNAAAQHDQIKTDRPSETQTPELVPKGFVQVEAGLRKEQHNASDYTLQHPNAQIKYGFTDRLEFRADISGASEKAPSKEEFRYGLTPVQLGFKATLLDAKGTRPQTALYTMLGIPALASKDHQVPHLAPQVRLLMENKINEKLELEYNIGAEWDGETTAPQWIAAIDPQWLLGNKWQLFTEVYGKWQRGESAEYVVDAGAGYFLSSNARLDVIGGKGLSQAAPDYFIEIGFSFRVRR